MDNGDFQSRDYEAVVGVGSRSEAERGKIQICGLAFLVFCCVLFSAFFAASTLPGINRSVEIELERRINPNFAPSASLVRLPGIGLSKAEAIIAYREQFIGRDGEVVAFTEANDMQKVRGIGPKTVEKLKPMLRFE